MKEKETLRRPKLSDQELLDCIRQAAGRLGRTPLKSEVAQLQQIKSRFGPWNRAVEAAGLEPPHRHAQAVLREDERRKTPERGIGP